MRKRLVILFVVTILPGIGCVSAPVYRDGGIVCRGGEWASGNSSAIGPVTTSENSLMNEINSWIGTPYIYGGTSKSGVDCSGFTQAVFRAIGIDIPRTASQQADAGFNVTPASLKFGDLLFFNTSGSGISHVGIFIGNGFFVHSSSSRGVVRESMASAYYSARLIQAGRFL